MTSKEIHIKMQKIGHEFEQNQFVHGNGFTENNGKLGKLCLYIKKTTLLSK